MIKNKTNQKGSNKIRNNMLEVHEDRKLLERLIKKKKEENKNDIPSEMVK